MEKTLEQRTRTESKTRLIEQINACVRSGDYSRVLDLLRGTAVSFPNDAELSGLEKLAEDGLKRKAEADRLITQSQELFAQRKSAEAIQLLRQAYELDKKNSTARSILANALVEHAHSVVETDWLQAERLTNQALGLNPVHPTAKTILSLIVDRKETSSVEDWVSQASKLQSAGDLFAALAWVAEGLAVHPHDLKLLQIQDAIQRDQETRRRQERRRDLDDLRRMEHDIGGARNAGEKQALAERIQAVAAKHWTDGEILSIANALLLRLGLVPRQSPSASPNKRSAAVIFHVPRPSAPNPTSADICPAPASPILPSPAVPRGVLPTQVTPKPTSGKVPADVAPTTKVPASPPEPRVVHPQADAEPPAPSATVSVASTKPKQPTNSNSTTLILFSAAAIILVAATFYFTRKHYAQPVAQTVPATAEVSQPALSASDSQNRPDPSTSLRAGLGHPMVSAPTVSVPAQTTSETPPPDLPAASDTSAGKVTPDDQRPAESSHDVGSLLIVAGQDDARVFLNGKPQRQVTQGGQLRLANLEPKEYGVQVSKSGFQDPPLQKIRIRNGEQARLTFNLQPQPSLSPSRLASLTIQGGAPGTAVLVDQTPVGTIQPDGTLSVSAVTPGDHTVELRKERFKPRQFKKHFVAGAAISLVAADAALEVAPAELKITFAPADANVAIVKGSLLKMVSSGVPLSLDAGTYTLTARTTERFTRSATLEVIAGESKTLDLSLAPNGMSKWEDSGAWKQEGDSFTRKGGDFVLYGVVPASGTFVFSAMLTKGHLLQWVLNYSDPKNYVLLQMDDNNFYRSVFRNGEKTDEIIVPHKVDKKSPRTFQIRVSPTEIVHQIKRGESWIVLDRLTQPGANLGKFGFYIPGTDQVAVSSFAHYGDLNIR